MPMLRLLLIVLLLANLLAFAAVQGWLGGSPVRTEPERLSRQLHPESIQLAGEVGAPAAHDAAPPVLDAAPDPASEAAQADDAAGPGAAAPAAAEDDAPAAADADTGAEAGAHEDSTDVATAGTAPAEAAPPPSPLSCVAWSELSSAQAEQLAVRLRRTDAVFTRSRSETPGSWWVRIPPQASKELAEQRMREVRALGVADSFIVQDSGPNRFAVSLGVFKTEARARQMLNQLRARGVTAAGVEPRMVSTFRIQAQLPAAALRSVEAGARIAPARRVPCPNR